MIFLMCQEPLASSASKRMDNFAEAVDFIKNCVSILFYQEYSIIFIVLRLMEGCACFKFYWNSS